MCVCVYICMYIYIYISVKVLLEEVNHQINRLSRDFPGGPVVKTLHFQLRWREFDPWSKN